MAALRAPGLSAGHDRGVEPRGSARPRARSLAAALCPYGAERDGVHPIAQLVERRAAVDHRTTSEIIKRLIAEPEKVFCVCALSPARIVSLQKIQGQLQHAGALETVAHYLALLEQAFLVASLGKHSVRPSRRRAAPPKLVVLNNAILAAVNPRGLPDRARDPQRYGACVENACLAHAWNAGQHVAYWREEPFEVDGVLDGSCGAWAIEVKTGPISAVDFKGLGEFTRRHPGYRPLVLCDEESQPMMERVGLPAMPWTEFLLGGPPGADLGASVAEKKFPPDGGRQAPGLQSTRDGILHRRPPAAALRAWRVRRAGARSEASCAARGQEGH